MNIDHLTADEASRRAAKHYAPHRFELASSGIPLLDAVAVAIAIQKALRDATIIKDHIRRRDRVLDTNWGDVLAWMATPGKDADDIRVLQSLVLDEEQVDLLEDFADLLSPVSKGTTRTSSANYKQRFLTKEQRKAINDRRAKAKKDAEERGEEYRDEYDDDIVSGVTIVVCDACDELAYVPAGFAAKKCSLTLGCEGTLRKPPACRRVKVVDDHDIKEDAR